MLSFPLNAQPQEAERPANDRASSGAAFEDSIEAVLEGQGVEVIAMSEWNEARLYEEPELTIAIRNVRYPSIYGHEARIEFLLLHNGHNYLIEAKRQRVPGSNDEKLPFVFMNGELNIDATTSFIVVMDGKGWKRGAIRWINERANETDGFYVLELNSFGRWLANLLDKEL